MNRQAWAIRHVDFEDLGILHPLLYSRGYEVRYLEALRGDLDTIDLVQPDLLIVLGGPMRATDFGNWPFLEREVSALRHRRKLHKPSLGICLGAQLMAVAAGGTVRPMPHKEIGPGAVALTDAGYRSCLRPLADGGSVLHWHGDEIGLPEPLFPLACTPSCPVQAFELEGPSLGLQFHLEADPDRIGEWTRGHSRELQETGMNATSIELELRLQASSMRDLGIRILATWLDGLPATIAEDAVKAVFRD